MVSALSVAGCSTVYLNGSFVTAKPLPNDFDGCWEPVGVDIAKLDPVLLDFDNRRAAQKAKYFGEMFVSSGMAAPGTSFWISFNRKRPAGRPRALLVY